ncbi:hypothetical protein FCN80_21125 [Martelella alba]|uniref:Uncharacterized protein n=1 Tax=Martelella alba TaxID=2590451 RepID=A0ABY2SH20_9HYPH|nr:hypothetical protein FCN80_21125 [Martelella alba]
MQTRNRAYRRHHMRRLKNKRSRYSNAGYHLSVGVTRYSVGRCYTTPCMCSCWLCGHQRHHFGPNMQERRAELKYKE